MNGYLIAMFAIYFVVALFGNLFIMDVPDTNRYKKKQLMINVVWFLIMGAPTLIKIWILGVLT